MALPLRPKLDHPLTGIKIRNEHTERPRFLAEGNEGSGSDPEEPHTNPSVTV